MDGNPQKRGPVVKNRIVYEVRVLTLLILWEWEEVHWGKTSFETKQRYHTAKHKLRKVMREEFYEILRNS